MARGEQGLQGQSSRAHAGAGAHHKEAPPALEEGTKRYIDALEVLRKAQEDQRTVRRGFEWKVTASLWAGLSAILGVLVATRSSRPLPPSCVMAVGIGAVFLHLWWVVGLQDANWINFKRATEIENRMRILLSEEEIPIREGILPIPWLRFRMERGTIFSLLAQVGPSVLLAVTASLLAYWLSDNPLLKP